MTGFKSYHWQDTSLPDRTLQEAYDALSEQPTPADARKLLETLLNSGNVIAESIALDFLSHASALQRHAVQNLPSHLGEHAARIARRNLLLDSDASEETGHAVRASACEALAHFGAESDTPLLIQTLNAAVDSNVVMTCSHALGNLLGGTHDRTALIRAIDRVLRGPYGDDVKRSAVLVLDRFETEEEAAFLQSILREAHPIGPTAALILANRDAERFFHSLREAIAAWPEDAPYPAAYVRGIVENVTPRP